MFTFYNSPRLGGKWPKSFLIGQYHFKNSLAVAFKIFFFSFEVWTVIFACWAYFYIRIAGWNNSFGRVTWENKYDVGRPETCKDPKNITEAILCTFLSVWLQIYIYILLVWKNAQMVQFSNSTNWYLGKKLSNKNKKHTCYWKIIKQHV